MRNIYLFILLFCGAFHATSQTTFGISGGYVLSTLIDGDGRTFDSEDLNGKLYSQSSIYGGLYAVNPFHDQLSMKYELNYVVTGGMLEAHIKDPAVSFISRVEFHQMQIPISLHYSPARNFSVHSGLSLGVKLKTLYKFTRYRIPANPIDLNKKLEKELGKETDANLTPLNLGVFAGAGYKISNRFGLTARYNYTVTNMSSQHKESLKMHFLQAGISYNLIR